MATKAAEYKIRRVYSADGTGCSEKALANRDESAQGKSMHNNCVGAELSDAQRIKASALRD
jgi:hypothetical protein